MADFLTVRVFWPTKKQYMAPLPPSPRHCILLLMPKGEYLQYGGQAVVEGVMMRSPRFFSIACRAPNGEIVVDTEAIEATWIGRQKWLKKPFLRGSLALFDSMALGSRAMKFATRVQTDEQYAKRDDSEVAVERQPSKIEKTQSGGVQDIAVTSTMIFAIVFGLALFNYMPNLVAEYSVGDKTGKHWLLTNFVTEMIKIALFLGYVGGIGLLPDIRRVFQYHGAEHKAINTLEAEQELSLDNCKAQTRLHPRCGTSFAIIVLILSLLIFTFVPRYPFGHSTIRAVDATVRMGIEIVILPFISGAAYELLRLAGKFRNQKIVSFFFKPGIWSQYLTTREPDFTQIEVSLTALKAVLEAEARGSAQKVAEFEDNVLESAPSVTGGIELLG